MWNRLSAETVNTESIESFKTRALGEIVVTNPPSKTVT